MCHAVYCADLRSQPTYEELKLKLARQRAFADLRSQPTYEELKLARKDSLFVIPLPVPSLPMRN